MSERSHCPPLPPTPMRKFHLLHFVVFCCTFWESVCRYQLFWRWKTSPSLPRTKCSFFPGLYRFFVSLDTWGVIEWCWCPTAELKQPHIQMSDRWSVKPTHSDQGENQRQLSVKVNFTSREVDWSDHCELLLLRRHFSADHINSPTLFRALRRPLFSSPTPPLPCHRRSLVSKHGFWHFTMFALPSSLHTARMISSNVHTW